ncbi:MAG: 50S ribosomal protein L18 [Candidatus Hydrogenedentes bacterium]|nr:50S ribosomal protein L18 [Candidatus Hydrogenedentota bacterium]
MAKAKGKAFRLARRKRRIRSRIQGVPERPRLSVFRSLDHIYAQIIDDTTGRTVASESSLAMKIKGGNIGAAREVGKALAEKAKAASVTRVQFDRGGRLYHGRLKALADAAREAGLEF